MVNIHVFNLNGLLSKSEKDQICLLETLKHQSNCKLFIWTEQNPEIQEIIFNSDFCKERLSNNNIHWGYIYDYLKCVIGSRYGGWFMELDQVVATDLGKLDFDENKSYFHKISERTFCAATWTPIYFKKNEDVSQILSRYEHHNYDDRFAMEFQTCQINGNFNDCGFLKIDVAHFSEELMGTADSYYQDKKILVDNNKVFLLTKKSDGNVDLISAELSVFIKVSKACRFFSNSIPTIKKRGYRIIMNEKAIKAFSEFDLSFGVEIQEDLTDYNTIEEVTW